MRLTVAFRNPLLNIMLVSEREGKLKAEGEARRLNLLLKKSPMKKQAQPLPLNLVAVALIQHPECAERIVMLGKTQTIPRIGPTSM